MELVARHVDANGWRHSTYRNVDGIEISVSAKPLDDGTFDEESEQATLLGAIPLDDEGPL